MAVLLENNCTAAASEAPSSTKPHVFVLTDISNEPGDEASVFNPFQH